MQPTNLTPIDDVKSRLKDTKELLWMAKEALVVVQHLNSKEPYEDMVIKRSNEFLLWSQIVNFRLAVIELHKLVSLSSGDKHSLNKLFNIIKMNPNSFSNIQPSDIAKWQSQLDAESSTVSKIATLRDKVYAHTDLKPSSHVVFLDLPDIDRLINVLADVINDLSNKLGEGVFSMIKLGLENINGIDLIVDALQIRNRAYDEAEKEIDKM